MRLPRPLAWVRQPTALLAVAVFGILAVLVISPLSGLVASTLAPGASSTWPEVVASPLSRNLLWTPLGNSVLVGLGTAVFSSVVGGLLAWIVVLTDVPGRRTIGALATIPFALPSFAIALSWETVFRNDRLGGTSGLLTSFGIAVPDALSWGTLPIILTLGAHYYSLSFVLIAASLASVGGDLIAAAEMTGASRSRIALRIALPVVAPAIISGALLAFAEGVSNFAVPALLGLPVRFQTLSTRLYGAIATGDTVRGYVLSIVLVAVAALVLWAGTSVTRKRSFETITGKSSRGRRFDSGPWKWPLFAIASAIVGATTIVPAIVLVVSTFTRRTNSFAGGLTTHFWVGESDPSIAQGQSGVLANPVVVDATISTIALGAGVAVCAILVGLAASYVTTRLRGAPVITGTIGFLSFVPFLIPGIALGAAFIAQFGAPIGPFPSLYGTLGILLVAGTAASLPFAYQTSRVALGQISADLEEAAVMTGATMLQRARRVLLPLAAPGIVGGAILVFVTMVRDLSLVVLLATPATPLLSVLTYRYASDGFTQFANAITVIIAVISVLATLLARRLQGASQPWMER
ncbi:ABC transporter permease [Marisediminicola sp. LYQ134]|uniref:ABC transporter permease n=1 Tax=unclassified Marisediminicola TaxID=2618316 RepID=UPI003983C7EB